jgi:hypothetical protein
VRGHEVRARPGVERDLEQMTRIEAEDGPSVRRDVADAREAGGDAIRGLEIRRVQEVTLRVRSPFL